ncbi:MAG: hypothetical protein Q8O88_02155 [bacterium]|nr:hypothetical protein [bacterium]
MQRKDKMMLRWSIISAGLIGAFWLIWYLVTGEMPVVDTLKVTKNWTVELPFGIPRWADLLIGPLFSCAIIHLYFSAGDDKKLVFGLTCGLVSGLVAGLVFGLGDGLGVKLVAGLVAGLVIGLGFELAHELAYILGAGLALGLVIGLASGLVAGIDAGMAFGLGFGLVIGLGFGLGVVFKTILSFQFWQAIGQWFAGK